MNPMWGKGLWQMEQKLEAYKNYNFQNVAVITAGNDIQEGAEYCQEVLPKIKKHKNVTIHNVIPQYSMQKPFKQVKIEGNKKDKDESSQ